MEITGRIIAVMEPRSGVSQKGTPWKAQEFVLEQSSGQYPRKMAFEVFGEDKLNEFNIQQGAEYRVSFDIDAREWNGRYYNSIRAWKVIPVQATQSVAPVQPANAFPPVTNGSEPPKDEGDLPF